jgi:hypothetical protein
LDLLKIDSFNDNENNFPSDTLQIENAYALETNNNNNDSKIVNDTIETENNINIINSLKEEEEEEEEVGNGLQKDSNNTDLQQQQQQKGMEYKDKLILNDSSVQNTELSKITTPETKSPSSKEGFNFAAAGDWACTSKAKDTVKNIIDHDPELVLALGDLSYDSSAKCWLKIIKPLKEKTKIVIGNHEADSSKKLKTYMKAFNLQKQYYSFNYLSKCSFFSIID